MVEVLAAGLLGSIVGGATVLVGFALFTRRVSRRFTAAMDRVKRTKLTPAEDPYPEGMDDA